MAKKKLKRYKALLLDVDGTLIPNKKDAMPSKKVSEAIASVSKIVHVGVASSRPIFLLRHIFDHLKLSGPSIINGGAQIVDITSQKVFYRQPIERNDILPIYKIVQKFNLTLLADTDEEEIRITGKTPNEEILGMYIPSLSEVSVEKLRKEIDKIPTVSSHITPSWTNDKEFVISVSHVQATKQHGVFELAKVLGIETDEIIGVGDGGNDFPLLMACGLKVAMGNATEDLKAIADYIAPSVKEDGVADVIEKFVLS